MDEYTILDCRLLEKKAKDVREYELNQFRTVVACIVNTTVTKKGQAKKPRDILELESDLIQDYHNKKVVLARNNKREARRRLDQHRKHFPHIKIPRSLMTEKELAELDKESQIDSQ